MAQLQVRQVRSAIGRNKNQCATLRSLGLRNIGDTTVRQDHPRVRGMIETVTHLVDVELVDSGEVN